MSTVSSMATGCSQLLLDSVRCMATGFNASECWCPFLSVGSVGTGYSQMPLDLISCTATGCSVVIVSSHIYSSKSTRWLMGVVS